MRVGRAASARLIAEGEGRFRVEGEVVFATVMKLLEDGEAAFAGSSRIEIDLGGVTRINTAGLGLVIEWLRRARHEGQTITIRRPPATLLALAQICEAQTILGPVIVPA
ncbi:MAG TPA: STAS domain-containing protein [Gammaproteobacteria bacterium]|nr:STAS domain-containing protein [Gammaproteobacteria bacterium]